MRRIFLPLLGAVLLVCGSGAVNVFADELEQGLYRDLREIGTQIDKARVNLQKGASCSDEIRRVKKLAEDIQATHLLVMERYRLRQEKAAELGGKAVERQAAVTLGYDKALREYLALIDAIPPDGAVTPATLENLSTLSKKLTGRKKRPILGSLPYKSLSYPAREPEISPQVTPAYMGGNKTVAPEDTATTQEAPLTPEIAELARTLNFSPVLIYEWVKNNVDTEWYRGCMKGAGETLRQKSGNDCDQAALLAALMRASGYPTRYVRGVIEFFPDIEKAKNLTGIDDTGRLADYVSLPQI